MDLGNVSTIVSLFAMLVSVLSCIIIKLYVQPFEATLERLNQAVEKLSDKMDNNIEKQDRAIDEIRERLVKVEASTSSAHKRLDMLKK